ncbi:MAG: 50S ribosomal protein L22 [Gammaproteobacteria bacterium]|jgi:large subunit ribosomal protein L22|nr:50S ribosomal protein L22 [Gammaproteobacteria bacterium]HJL79904.1 50S ribosomal protein L22 [Gammaproteobacteria bacterium]HJN00580.1 50S ribosomal protein L22 [Gammaproteobacteria bacterium]|tara:strand:- start:2833 stop:3165 length:333 start_codon:yes stop_codon:yes gene_type:complete
MKVTSTLRYAKISPQKTRLIVDMIRDSDVLSAMRLVKFLPQKAAKIVSKILDSAVANAENNLGLDIDDLKVSRVYVDEAPTFKRFRARARGRGTRILKRNSHITIELSDE